MNTLSTILVLGLSFCTCTALGQSRVYDPCFRLTMSNTFYFLDNSDNNNFLNTDSETSYGFMLNNSFNIGKESAISIGLSYAQIGGEKYRRLSIVSFPIMFHKYFNPKRDKLNVAVILNPGMDLLNESRPILNFGYNIGYRLKKHGNIGLTFEIFTEDVDGARLMDLGVFYEYYFFRK